MEKLDTIRKNREDRFWDRRMKKAEHHKKEMIKSNLIKNQTLIYDPEIRKKVEELEEKRSEKRRLRFTNRLNKNKLNMGLDNQMDIEGVNNNVERVEKIKVAAKKGSKKKAKKVAKNQKMIIDNENNIEVE
jgi:hypothetical protein